MVWDLSIIPVPALRYNKKASGSEAFLFSLQSGLKSRLWGFLVLVCRFFNHIHIVDWI